MGRVADSESSIVVARRVIHFVLAGRLKASPADLIREERAEMALRTAARARRQGGRR